MDSKVRFDRKFYSVSETADMLRVSPWSIRTWLRLGRLQSCKVGARVLIPGSALAEFVQPRPIAHRMEEQ